MKRVIIFGELPIATKVLLFLNQITDVEIVGAVTQKRNKGNVDPFDCPSLYDYCIKENIPIFSFQDLRDKFQPGDLDFGFSVRFSYILKEDIISLFKYSIMNFHGGLLPEFAGLYSSCHTILQESAIAGGTLHLITDSGIDSGNILKRCEFPTELNDTSETIFQKTQLVLFDGFCEIVNDFLEQKVESISQQELVLSGKSNCYYDKKSLVKELFLDNDIKRKISVHARGFEFTGHERGYIVVDGMRIYFTTKNLEGFI